MTNSLYTPVSQDILSIIDSRGKNLNTYQYSYKLSPGGFGLDVPIDNLDIDESACSMYLPVCSGVRRDGVGDLLHVDGIRVERHRKNPIVGFDHFKQVSLPIARMREDPKDPDSYTFHIDAINKRAGGRIFFWGGKANCDAIGGCDQYEHAKFCQECFHMAANGFLNAGSIGYSIVRAEHLPPDYSTGTPQGLELREILKLESSVVCIPASIDTVGKALTGGKINGAYPSSYFKKAFSPYLPPKRAQVVSGYDAKALRVPNYREAEDPEESCETCEAYAPQGGQFGHCRMFDVTVGPTMTCDRWVSGETGQGKSLGAHTKAAPNAGKAGRRASGPLANISRQEAPYPQWRFQRYGQPGTAFPDSKYGGSTEALRAALQHRDNAEPSQELLDEALAAAQAKYSQAPEEEDFYGGYQQPGQPTESYPGTEEKVNELARRAQDKTSLWHPQDTGYDASEIEPQKLASSTRSEGHQYGPQGRQVKPKQARPGQESPKSREESEGKGLAMGHGPKCKCAECQMKYRTKGGKSCGCSACSKGHACPCGEKSVKHIVHEPNRASGHQWVLYNHDKTKVLGTHPSKEKAEAQERAVEAHKHGKGLKGIKASIEGTESSSNATKPIADEIPTERVSKPGIDGVSEDDYDSATPHMVDYNTGVGQYGGQYTQPRYSGRLQGYQARQGGADRTQNPYPRGTQEYENWREGWDDQHFIANPETYGKDLENEEETKAEKGPSGVPSNAPAPKPKQPKPQQAKPTSAAPSPPIESEPAESDTMDRRGFIRRAASAVASAPPVVQSMLGSSAATAMGGIPIAYAVGARQRAQRAAQQQPPSRQTISEPTSRTASRQAEQRPSAPEEPASELSLGESQPTRGGGYPEESQAEESKRSPAGSRSQEAGKFKNPEEARDFESWKARVSRRSAQAAEKLGEMSEDEQIGLFRQYGRPHLHGGGMSGQEREKFAAWLENLKRTNPNRYRMTVQNSPAARLRAFRTDQQELAGRPHKSMSPNSYEWNAKSLKDLKDKYRQAQGRFHRSRRATPGAIHMHLSSRNLEPLRKDAEGKGVEVHWVSDDGKGGCKVKLIGIDGVLEDLAKKYAKAVRKVKSIPSQRVKSDNVIGTIEQDEKVTQGKSTASRERASLGNLGDTLLNSEGGTEEDDGSPDHTGVLTAKGKSMKKTVTIEHEDGAKNDLQPNPKGAKKKEGDGGVQGEGQGEKVPGEDYQGSAESKEDGLQDDESPEAEGSKEPYGAQVARRLHADMAGLLHEYDEFLDQLEDDATRNLVLKQIQHFVTSLEEIEEHASTHPRYKGIFNKSPLEGVEANAGAGPEAKQFASSFNSGIGATSGMGEEETPDDALLGMERSEEPTEEPTPLDAMAGLNPEDEEEEEKLKALYLHRVKSLRSKYQKQYDKLEEKEEEYGHGKESEEKAYYLRQHLKNLGHAMDAESKKARAWLIKRLKKHEESKSKEGNETLLHGQDKKRRPHSEEERHDGMPESEVYKPGQHVVSGH